jgi:hypothetical protein
VIKASPSVRIIAWRPEECLTQSQKCRGPYPAVIQRGVHYPPEEPPMTMQIAMIGSDGIVLASDTKQTRTPLPDHAAKRYGFGSSKIGITESKRIAATCAMK